MKTLIFLPKMLSSTPLDIENAHGQFNRREGTSTRQFWCIHLLYGRLGCTWSRVLRRSQRNHAYPCHTKCSWADFVRSGTLSPNVQILCNDDTLVWGWIQCSTSSFDFSSSRTCRPLCSPRRRLQSLAQYGTIRFLFIDLLSLGRCACENTCCLWSHHLGQSNQDFASYW